MRIEFQPFWLKTRGGCNRQRLLGCAGTDAAGSDHGSGADPDRHGMPGTRTTAARTSTETTSVHFDRHPRLGSSDLPGE